MSETSTNGRKETRVHDFENLAAAYYHDFTGRRRPHMKKQSEDGVEVLVYETEPSGPSLAPRPAPDDDASGKVAPSVDPDDTNGEPDGDDSDDNVDDDVEPRSPEYQSSAWPRIY